jgi:DNA-binding Lrp family transcriptional regulator
MNKEIERLQQKTSEGEFVYELETQYELSPKMRESILETAKRCLIRDYILKEGEIEVSIIGIEEKSGKVIEKMEKVRVRLTIDNGKEDAEVLKENGRTELRRVQLQRITQEALEQNGVLSQEDLSKHLRCTVRTIKRDIRAIKGHGIDVITRGVLHNIGRGQTHKSKIVGLYLEGKTFSDIKLKTHHSVGSIKRYLESFVKVLMSVHHGIKNEKYISSVTGLSELLVRQYIELLRVSRKDKGCREKLEDIIRQWNRVGTKLKKRVILDEFGRKAVHMTGVAI